MRHLIRQDDSIIATEGKYIGDTLAIYNTFRINEEECFFIAVNINNMHTISITDTFIGPLNCEARSTWGNKKNGM